MEPKLQQIIDMIESYSIIIDHAKQRADEGYRTAAKYYKEGRPFEARKVLYAHYISTLAYMRLKTYLSNKLKGLANEL